MKAGDGRRRAKERSARGVGEAPTSSAGALSPRHSSGGLRHMLFSADERHDHETLNLADIEQLDEMRDKIRHRGIERRLRRPHRQG